MHPLIKTIKIILILLFFISAPLTAGLNVEKQSHEERKMDYHIRKANQYTAEYNLNKTREQLDSASLYINGVDNPSLKGLYHLVRGDYYNHSLMEVESHLDYYQALHYLEKVNLQEYLPYLYHNLAFWYIEKNDAPNLKVIMDKINKLEQSGRQDTIILLNLNAHYYKCLFNKNKDRTDWLDSCISYNQRVAAVFETGKSDILPEEMAYTYANLAANTIRKGDQNPAAGYLEKACKLASPQDTAIIVNCLWIEGEINYKNEDYQGAKEVFLRQLDLMEKWKPDEKLSIYIDIYERLSRIAMQENDYETAFRYEQKKDACVEKIHDAEKYRITQELQTKYETNKKDMEIAQWKALSASRKKINNLTWGIAALISVCFFFVIRWLHAKRKTEQAKLEVVRLEKNEVELQAALKEEKLKQVELEKYEALLDSHFKDREISGMDGKLCELENERNHLVGQIEEYGKRLRQYERGIRQKPGVHFKNSLYLEAVTSMERLINKNLSDSSKKSDYIEKLTRLDELFFERLTSCYDEPLSAINIKYCICFALGMEADDMAVCLSVEKRSLYVTRHRLRKKLNTDVGIDFEAFLRQL